MKGLTIFVLAAVTLGVASGMVRSRTHSNNSAAGTADMPTMQDFQSAAAAKAPVKDIEGPIIGIPP